MAAVVLEAAPAPPSPAAAAAAAAFAAGRRVAAASSSMVMTVTSRRRKGPLAQAPGIIVRRFSVHLLSLGLLSSGGRWHCSVNVCGSGLR